jgi:hypothetical protein
MSHSNTVRLWQVELPDSLGAKHDDWKETSTKMIQILGTLLAEVSVLKSSDLTDVVTQRMKDGLSHKLLAGLPYPVIAVNAGFTYWIFPLVSVMTMQSAACSTAAARPAHSMLSFSLHTVRLD